MHTLMPTAEKIAVVLKARRETLAVAESSTGGLIAACMLAVPGASAYFMGGAVVYTREARRALMQISDDAMRGLRSSSEPYAQLLANTIRDRHGATWGLAETGAAGPSGNRYGDAAGHSCIAVAGAKSVVLTLETAVNDRQANMRAFALKALETFLQQLEAGKV